MATSNKGRIIVLSAIAAALLAAIVFITAPSLVPRSWLARRSHVSNVPLDIASDRLNEAYLNPNLVAISDYEESPYPHSFAKDGLGSLDTKPFCSTYHEPLSGELRSWLQAQCSALERDSTNKKILGEIALELGHRFFCTRMVPYADRFRAAGGELTLAATSAYLPGLVRLGRCEEAIQHYKAAQDKWGAQLTRRISATLFKDLFLRAWVVDRSVDAMLIAMREGLSTGLSDTDRYYVLEVFSEHLRRAASRREMGWFLPHLEKYWVWFPEDRLEEAIRLITAAGLRVPEALLNAADPLYKNGRVPPQAQWLRAIASMNRGDSGQALLQAERAVELSKSADRLIQLEALMILARVLRNREDLERAFEVTSLFERLATESKADDQIGWGLVMKGFLYERLADYRNAAETFSAAAAIGDRIGYAELASSARSYRARSLCETGLAGEVEEYLHERADEAVERHLASNVPSAYYAWGKCLSRLGRYDDAISAFRRPVEYGKNVVGGNYDIEHTVMVSCILEQGRAYLAKLDFAAAEEAFTKGESLSKESHVATAAWPWQLGLATARRGLGDSKGAARLVEDCLRTVEAERASLKDFQHRRTLNDNKYRVYALAVELAIERGDSATAFLLSEQSRARAFLDEMGVASAGGRPPSPKDLSTTIAALRDITLVVYFQVSDRLLAWVVRDGTADFIPLEGMTPAHVTQAVAEFSRAIASEARVPTKPALEEAKRLYTLLWKPVADKVGASQRICIVPHGVLHYVPFQALHDGTSFLIEKHDLFYSASASALLKLRDRKIVPSADFSALDAILSDDPASPFSKTETAALQSQHPKGIFFLNKEATPDAFKENAIRCGVVHLSCHGFFNPWIPLDSGLVLAPESAGDKRILRARDIYGLRFNNTALVVMSACVSSVGDLAGGDEVTGLTRAFQVAGVPNVIGSLWPVENVATTNLMTEFHLRLLETGDPTAALRAAQRLLAAQGVPLSKWAAFEVTGDGKTLTAVK